MNLLCVSKQVFHETRLMPCAANGFVFISPPSFETFMMNTLAPFQAQALRNIAIWAPMGALNIMDESVSWKTWSLPPQIQNSDLLCGLRRITLNFSMYDELSMLRLDEVHRLLDFASSAGIKLKDLEINVTLNEADRPDDEPEIDVYSICQQVEELRRTALKKQRFY